ncbi:MAG: DUF819 family protein [Defluviitaleaceae bacterium]|nr:DUF819 family protein [Defluviitaleaceae bacterium]
MAETATTLIAPDDTVLMWVALLGIVGAAVSMEGKWKWAKTVSSMVICIILGIALANFRVIPFASPVYGNVSGILLPLAIPLLLFKSDLKRIIKESGQFFVIYNIIAAICFVGALLIPLIFGNVEGIREYAAAQTGGFIGGTVNVVALSQIFALTPEFLFGITIVGNFFVAVMVFFINIIYRSEYIRKNFRIGADEEDLSEAEVVTDGAAPTQISMVSIMQCLAIAFAVFGTSSVITRWVNSIDGLGFVTRQIFGNNFILMTFITVALATIFPKFLTNVKGASEIGTLLMLVWFVTIGTTANIALIVSSGLIVLFSYTMVFIMATVGILFCAKKFNWRVEGPLASLNACIGGPPTVAALVATMKWNKILVPLILMALWGVIIGNLTGIAIGNIWGALPFSG